jgi:hypothetical protein
LDADTFARGYHDWRVTRVSIARCGHGAGILRTEIVHDTAQHSDALVADRPFRYTRNPLYLANLPMAAESMFSRAVGIHFLFLANWIFVYRLILRRKSSATKARANRIAYCETGPVLAGAQTARSAWKSSAAMGPGIGR